MKEFGMKKWWKKFAEDESGATALEYGLFAALIAFVILVAVQGIGVTLNNVFTKVGSAMQNTLGTPGTGS